MSTMTKKDLRVRRHYRVRNKVYGTASRPRMSIFRSNKKIALGKKRNMMNCLRTFTKKVQERLCFAR